MSEYFEKFIHEYANLPLIPLVATSAYQENIPILTRYVDETLANEPSIHALIGHNPLQIIYDNHRHHAFFMATIFSIGNYELLAKTLPWVYRAYAAHGFSYAYFVLELQTWLLALDKYLDPTLTSEIKIIYHWMLDSHEGIIAESQRETSLELPISPDWLETKTSFLSAILRGDHRKCIEIATQSIVTLPDVEKLYLQILQPVMYEVGMLWERAEISVAQEHLASAIVGRVMVSVQMMDLGQNTPKGKAVITAAPNEFHEIGAWMVSDILEHDGWDVRYLGANTPAKDLIALLCDFHPDILALSVTMPFNILKAKETISAIRKEEKLAATRIMVGGRAFNDVDTLWQSTGADGFAANVQQVTVLADQWRRQ